MTNRSVTAGENTAVLSDWALAVAVLLFNWLQLAVIQIFLAGAPPGPGGPGPGDIVVVAPLFNTRVMAPTMLAFVLVAVACLPLVWRRRFPVSVVLISVVATSVYDLTRQPPILLMLAPLIALYTAGTFLERRRLVPLTVVAIAIALVTSLPGQPTGRVFAEAVRITALFAFAAAVGDATRNRRAYVAEVEQRALEAERSREENARRRVEEERLRIARELHDVTAHSLSIIAVQAGAATQVVESDPEGARQALEAIRATSKSALDELRAILGVMRGGEDEAPLAPAGSITRLGELTASVEQSGVSVDLKVGDVGDVPAYVEVSTYRIVQEALTNVVRHAGARLAVVAVDRSEDELTIVVTDDGVGASVSDAAGHGITGMRERVAALGGAFSAGPAPGGGFRVTATIPLAGRDK
ncbi:MAG: sensor histidine kinase [Coriobacteriia bacterium]|nr:sensor histidine kinase [Coriobacteriia bacterium]